MEGQPIKIFEQMAVAGTCGGGAEFLIALSLSFGLVDCILKGREERRIILQDFILGPELEPFAGDLPPGVAKTRQPR